MESAILGTADILKGMLQENTGRHMLDSGGAYGRNWEKNQKRDFESEPAATVSFKHGFIFTLNVYHFLKERLEYAPALQERYDRFVEGREDTHDLEDMEEFTDHLEESGEDIAGFDGGGPRTTNTYNGEDCLSQVLQYHMFMLDDVPYILLQIHGGYDVRGGYTSPKAFEVVDCNDGWSMCDNARGMIYCDSGNCHAVWDMMDGYYFEPADNEPKLDVDKLEVDEDADTAVCPMCKKGKLAADGWTVG